MGDFETLLSFEEQLNTIDAEIILLKKKKHRLLATPNFSVNEQKSAYLNLELKKLERLHVKKKQFIYMKSLMSSSKVRLQQNQHIGSMEVFNERCIQLLIKRLFEEGYGQELRMRGLVPQFNSTEVWSTRRFFNMESSIGGNHQ